MVFVASWWLGSLLVEAQLPGWAESAAAAILVAAGLLSLRFRQGRTLLAVIAVGAVAVLRWSGVSWPQWVAGNAEAIAALFAAALPVILAVVAALGECRPWGRRGLIRLGYLLLLLGLLLGLAMSFPERVLSSLGERIQWREVSLPWSAAPGLFLALPAVALRAILQPHPLHRALFWSSATAVLALFGTRVSGPTPVSLPSWLLRVLETAYHLAFTDSLTGLPSRRRLEEELEDLPRQFCIAMVDVDRFKGVNDRYGHEVGDQVLAMIASHLRRAPGGARAYRYGGEEFVMLFPGLTAAGAEPHAEALRARLAESPFRLRSSERPKKKPRSARRSSHATRRIRVTVSIGLAAPTPKHQEPREVLRRADQALYRAKKRGRNRVCR